MWPFSEIHWDLYLWGGLYEMSSQQGNAFPPVASQGSTLCSQGFAFPTGAPSGIELWRFRLCAPPVYRVLMEIKLSPFSFLHFLFSPCGCVHSSFFFFFLSCCFLQGGAFTILPHPPHPHLHPLSSSRISSLHSAASLPPSSPLHATYLLSFVVQVVKIDVLILKSVF